MRVAVWLHGGISGGPNNEGMPVLHQLFEKLQDEVALCVFCQWPVAQGAKPFRVVSPPGWLQSSRLRWGYLLFRFLMLHLFTRFQIVHGFWGMPGGKIAVRLARWFGGKSVVTFMGGEAAKLEGMGYGMLLNRKREVLNLVEKADALVILSGHAWKQLAAEGARRSHHLECIQFGLVPNRFTYQPGLWQKPLQLVCVGNVYPVKDQETVLRGFAKVLEQVDARLTILGGDFGGYTEKMKALAQELGISEKVLFTGAVPYSMVAEHLQGADILVHASRHEGQGLIYVEAMASGTAVVATPLGMAADAGEEVVSLFDFGDEEGLARAVLALHQGEELRQRKLVAGQSLAKAYTTEATVQGYVQLYTKLLHP